MRQGILNHHLKKMPSQIDPSPPPYGNNHFVTAFIPQGLSLNLKSFPSLLPVNLCHYKYLLIILAHVVRAMLKWQRALGP